MFDKISKVFAFVSLLGIISILGLMSNIAEAVGWFGLERAFTGGIFIAVGIALGLIGGWNQLLVFLKDKTRGNEILPILSMMMGAGSVVVGILTIFDIASKTFNTFKIVIAGALIILIAVQTWRAKASCSK